jgi:hypothetical protein
VAEPAIDNTAQLARDLALAHLGRAQRATYEALGTAWTGADVIAKQLGYATPFNTATRLKKLLELGLVERTGQGCSGDGYRWRRA